MSAPYRTDSNGQIHCLGCGTTCFDWAAFEGHPCDYNYHHHDWVNNSYTTVRREETEMANVVICDRDGTIVKSDVIGQAFYQPNPTAEGKRYMLCPECAREMHNFLTAGDSTAPIMAAFDPDAEPVSLENHNAETSNRALEHHTSDDEAYNLNG